ncbi:MAG: acyl transferase [Bacteroidetes bacterium]|nr:acyl transferase [Bacteroidota bacterium]
MQEKILISNNFDFDELALEVFRFQYKHNSIYRQYVDYLNINATSVDNILDIPFLPIEFFKTHQVVSTSSEINKVFESSGTTSDSTSKHFISDLSLYETSFETCFKQFYGDINDWIILALLPSYLERNNSSLVYMVDHLIKKTNNENSGFYLHNLTALQQKLAQLLQATQKQKILLIGVTFALLDFAEQFPMKLSDVVIMETGGMKGRRKELLREEVHEILKNSFNVSSIHSEYGMTELLSQAYSDGNGIFRAPSWMKCLKRDIYNPLHTDNSSGRGALNIIDLANINSCAFIATQDMVNLHEEASFEIIGRINHADIRGCNLLI